jgi:hypothetical protein
VIGFTGEQRLRFELGDIGLRAGELAIQLFQQIVALLGIGLLASKADVGFDVARKGSELRVGRNLGLGAFAVAKNALSGFLVAPEVRSGAACFEGFQALAMLRGVKESSAPARCAA